VAREFPIPHRQRPGATTPHRSFYEYRHPVRTPKVLSPWRPQSVSNPLIVHTSDATFDADVLQSPDPVLLDFWAEWCGPCKMIAPILDEAANDYKGRLKIAKLNIDENPQTPPRFGIRGIPTLILFKDGNVAAQKVGAMSRSQLTAFLEQNLSQATSMENKS
jgi:thioredoxin 1